MKALPSMTSRLAGGVRIDAGRCLRKVLPASNFRPMLCLQIQCMEVSKMIMLMAVVGSSVKHLVDLLSVPQCVFDTEYGYTDLNYGDSHTTLC